MGLLIPAVFVATYAGMAAGRVPGLRLDRTGIALIAVAVLLAAGAVDVPFIAEAVDAATLILLFALMVVSAQFSLSGFYELCAARVVAAQLTPAQLLAATVAVSGVLSAILVNDIVVFAMTPLLAVGVRGRGLDPRPYLLAVAAASNAGSAATIIGNPQNILIGQLGGLHFWKFVAVCAPVAALSLVAVHVVIAWAWRTELRGGAPLATPITPQVDRWQVGKALLATAALIGLLSLPIPREAGALAVAALLLASRRTASRTMLGTVDWNLLLLFACLFTVTAAFAGTGVSEEALAWLIGQGWWPDNLVVLAPLALAMSNTIGNVPAVVLLTALWPAPPEGVLYGLALLSTLAGNLLIVGSIANLIVAERAAACGVHLGFAEFARAGIPIALVTMLLAAAWLAMTGWMPITG